MICWAIAKPKPVPLPKQALQLKNPRCVVYTEITSQAVQQAIAHSAPHQVVKLERKTTKQLSPPPFISLSINLKGEN
jgi:hypothetical protein